MRGWKPRGYQEVADAYGKTIQNCLDEVELLKAEKARLREQIEYCKQSYTHLLRSYKALQANYPGEDE